MNVSAPGVRLVPLLPISARDVTILDIVAPVVLCALALLLHTLAMPQEPTRPGRAHIYKARTAHARFLPREAAGRFSYPVLYLGFDLHALESGGLDLGRLFAYRRRKRRRRWSLLSVNPRNYLGAIEPRDAIFSRLVDLVVAHGVPRDDVASAYTVAMPGVVGFEDINPLTTHFCHDEHRRLVAVVLEVSNTFGEKHAYVLRVGVDEDAKPARGFDHRWTFPRAFHVSPFNDRSGFYRVSVTDPLRSGRPPTLSIHIALLTSDHRKKLVATLEGVGEPLTDGGLIGALLRYPLELFLTTPRILYQAAKLHFGRRLDVYPRPEPHVASGVSASVNPVQHGGRAASVLWQDWAGGDSRAARLVGRTFEAACARHEASGERVQVAFEAEDVSRDRLVVGPDPPDRTLVIRYASPLVFTDLLMLPTAETALLIGSRTERRWRASDEALFRQLWPGPPGGSLVRGLRGSHLRWSTSFAPSMPDVALEQPPPPVPLRRSDGFALLREVWSTIVSERLGYAIFSLAGARFVAGTEPWAAWARVGRAEGVQPGDGFGSVLRTRA